MSLCPFLHLLGMSPTVNGHLRVGGPCWQALALTAVTLLRELAVSSLGSSAVFQMKTPQHGDIAGSASSEVPARISKVLLPSPPDLESKLLIRSRVWNCIAGTELAADSPFRGICGNHCLWYL